MKKTLAIVLAALMLVALLPTIALAADDYVTAYAAGVIAEAENTAIGSKNVARFNSSLAFGKPQGTGKEGTFVSLRYYNYIDFEFADETGNVAVIYNYNKPEDKATVADLSLSEVTWGDWHIEVVDVYLLGATVMVNGMPVSLTEPLCVGRAYNKIGISKLGLEAKYYTAQGDIGYSNVFFPDDVICATGVRLVDKTTEENTPVATFRSYNVNDDGYDLDAVIAWHAKTPGTLSAEFSATKFIDDDADGIWDDDENFSAIPFLFELQVWKDGAYVKLTEAYSDALGGTVAFSDLTDGAYKLIEVVSNNPDYTLTTPVNGIAFTVVGGELVCDVAPENRVFGNAKKMDNPPVYGGNDTAWAGLVTSDSFAMYNKKNAQVSQGNVFRSGKSAWAMAIRFDGSDATYDLIMGQYTKVGTVSITAADGYIYVTYNVDAPQYKLGGVHTGAYASIDKIPNGNGQFNGVMGDQANVYKIPYAGGVVYLPIHAEVASKIN